VYSTVDRASLRCAEETLQCLWKSDSVSSKAVILVGNKTDLVRSRTVSTEGKSQEKSKLVQILLLKGKAPGHASEIPEIVDKIKDDSLHQTGNRT
jgi:Rad/Gem-related GTP binding protein 1